MNIYTLHMMVGALDNWKNAYPDEFDEFDQDALDAGRQAIAEAEKQEPVALSADDLSAEGRQIMSFARKWYLSNSTVEAQKASNSLLKAIHAFTSPPQRQPLTDEQMFEFAEIAWRHGWASCRDAEYVGEEAEDERWGMIGAEVVQDIAAHGIKGEA